MKLLINGESGYMHAIKRKDIAFSMCYSKMSLFRAITLYKWLFHSQQVYRGKRVTFRAISVAAI